jgi:hypothetical protein
VKIIIVLLIFFYCNPLFANNHSSLLLPSLFAGSPIFSNINVAQHSSSNFRFQLLYENRFLLKDVSPKFISFEKSFGYNIWTLSFSDWGSKYYKERRGQLNYAIHLNPKLWVGVGTLVEIVSKSYDEKSTVQLYPSFGIQYFHREKSNLFTSTQIGLDRVFSYKTYLGYCYEFIPSYKLFVLATSSSNEKFLISAGIKHKRDSGNEFILQLNSKNYPAAVAYNLTVMHFSFRLSMYYHLQLGMSNHVGIGYQSIP